MYSTQRLEPKPAIGPAEIGSWVSLGVGILSFAWGVATWFKDRALTNKLRAAEAENIALKEQRDQLVAELAQANTTIEVMAAEMRTGAERDQNVQMTGSALANGRA